MDNNKADRLKTILIQQYSKINGLSDSQALNILENINWNGEFKNMRSRLRYYKVFDGVLASLILFIAISGIVFNKKPLDSSALIILFSMIIFFIALFYRERLKTTEKMRILSLLFEIYKK